MNDQDIRNALWAVQNHQTANLAGDIARAMAPVADPPETLRPQYRQTIANALAEVGRAKDSIERNLNRIDREADHDAYDIMRPLWDVLSRAERDLEKAAKANPVEGK